MIEEQKVAHETLSHTLRHMDVLVEQHSNTVLVVSGVLLGFASSHLDSPHLVYVIAIFGIIIALEWFLKIMRLKQIFYAAHEKLVEVETELPFKTARPLNHWFNGFTILHWFSVVFIILWVSLATFKYMGDQTTASASQAVNDVLIQFPATVAMPGSKWDVLSLNWDQSSGSYELIVETRGTSEKWLVRYDAIGKRIIHFENR